MFYKLLEREVCWKYKTVIYMPHKGLDVLRQLKNNKLFNLTTSKEKYLKYFKFFTIVCTELNKWWNKYVSSTNETHS